MLVLRVDRFKFEEEFKKFLEQNKPTSQDAKEREEYGRRCMMLNFRFSFTSILIAWEIGRLRDTYRRKMNDIVHFLNKVKGVDKPTDPKDKYGNIILQRLNNLKREEVEEALKSVKESLNNNEPINVETIFRIEKCNRIPGTLFLANCTAQLLF